MVTQTKGEHPNTKFHWTWSEGRTLFKINWLINWEGRTETLWPVGQNVSVSSSMNHPPSPPHVITSDYSPSYSKDRFPPRNRSCGRIPTPQITYVDNRKHNYVLTFLCGKLGPKTSKATWTCEEKRLEMKILWLLDLLYFHVEIRSILSNKTYIIKYEVW